MRALLGSVAVLAIVALTSTAHAEDRSGFRPEVLSLPTGPGSIEGLGESFEPNLNTGTSSYSVSLDLPPGVAGFAPELGLHYSSGAPNGDVGLGWSLGLPSVQVRTDRGLPRYDGTDTIVVRGLGGSGAEDLIRMPDGYYRFRIEGAFARAERRADGTWEVRNRSGVRFLFGTTASSTVAAGADVFEWLLTEQLDVRGHRISYEWERDATGSPYLVRVVYNDFAPDVRNEIVLSWSDRPDASVSYVSTFAVTHARRLNSVDIRHGGALVSRYTLAYSEAGGISRLISVRMVGSDGVTALPTLTFEYAALQAGSMQVVSMTNAPARALEATSELDDVDGDALPDLLLMDPSLDGGTYSYYPNLDGTSFGPRQVMSSTPSVWLNSADVQLADLDGDGASDVVARVSGAPDGFRYYPGSSTGFGAETTVSPNLPTGFSDPSIRLIDLDHDRLADWMRIDSTLGTVSVGFNRGNGVFEASASLPPIDPNEVVSFEAGARFADCNGDGLQDIVLLRSASLRCWPSRGRGRFAAVITIGGAPVLSAGELMEAQVRDINGDGLADVLHVGVSQVRIWTSVGGTSLSTPIVVSGTPSRDVDTTVRVVDINANGSDDIVWVDPTNAAAPWRYLDVLGGGSPGLITKISNGLGQVSTVSYAGIGHMRAWARANSVPWNRRSSAGLTVVSQVAVSDSLGGTVVTDYHYADAFFSAEQREFRGFATTYQALQGDTEQPTLVRHQTYDVGDTREATHGLVETSEETTADGVVFSRTTFRNDTRVVALAQDGTPIVFAFVGAKTVEIFEGQGVPIATRTEWTYDDNGSMTSETKLGRYCPADPACGNDETIHRSEFASNYQAWILGVQTRVTTESRDGIVLRDERRYYDGENHIGLPFGQVGALGEVRRIESLVGANQWAPEESYAHDEHGNVVETRDSVGGWETRAYDDASHTFIVSTSTLVADSEWLTWTAEYDGGTGAVLAVTDPNGVSSSATFDPLGRVLTIRSPGDPDDEPTRTFEYHVGNPISYVRELTRLNATDTSTKYAYTDGSGRARGQAASLGDGRWQIAGRATYGARGFETFSEDPVVATNADWNPPTSPLGARFVYDALGRRIRELRPENSETTTSYFPLRVQLFAGDDLDPASPNFNTPFEKVYDGQERLIAVSDRLQSSTPTTTYTYDAAGSLTRVQDPIGAVRTMEYDLRGRRVAMHDPDAGTWTYSFDERDNPVSTHDPRGFSIQRRFDVAGRMVHVERRDGGGALIGTSTSHYDAPHSSHPASSYLRGRLAWVEDDAGIEAHGYDARGRAVWHRRLWNDGQAHEDWYSYDRADRVVARGFPDRTHVELSYDLLGRLSSINGLVGSIEYTPRGGATSIAFENGVVETRQYDDLGRERRVRDTGPDGETIRNVSFEFNANSSLRAIVDEVAGAGSPSSQTAAYEYDARNRLRTETRGSLERQWQYDDVGNILSIHTTRDSAQSDQVFRYGERGYNSGRLTSAGSEIFEYDAAGNLLSDAQNTYAWDESSGLTTVTRGDTTVSYIHDSEGRVVQRVTRRGGAKTEDLRFPTLDIEVADSRITRLVGLAQQLRLRLPSGPSRRELAAASTDVFSGRGRREAALGLAALLMLAILALSRVFKGTVRSRGLAIASLALAACGPCGETRPPSEAIEVWPDQATLFLNDTRGTPNTTLDANGSVVGQRIDSAYGVVVDRSGEGTLGVGLEGTRENGELGIDEFAARPYRADLGRFLAVDPAVRRLNAPLEWHAIWGSYTYSGSNPVMYRDPDGHCPPCAAIVLAEIAVGGEGLALLGIGVSAAALTGGYIATHPGATHFSNEPEAGQRTRDWERVRTPTIPAPPRTQTTTDTQPETQPDRPGRPVTTGRTIAPRQRIGTVFVTYTLVNPTNGLVYAGRARGPIFEGQSEAQAARNAVRARFSTHRVWRARGYGSPALDKSSVTYSLRGTPDFARAYAAIRGREQHLIDELKARGVGAPQDRGVDPRRQAEAVVYDAAATAHFGPVGSDTPIPNAPTPGAPPP